MKYLVELNSPNVSADYILSELHLEFGRSPEATGDPDILRLKMDEGAVLVLVDYDNNRLWLTIETEDRQHYATISSRIEALLNRSKNRGHIVWSQIQVDN
jgi:hypothetical protein